FDPRADRARRRGRCSVDFASWELPQTFGRFAEDHGAWQQDRGPRVAGISVQQPGCFYIANVESSNARDGEPAVGGPPVPSSRACERGGLESARREGPRVGALVSWSLGARQGGSFNARCELHWLVLLERLRQGRSDHVGEPGRRLPVDRPGDA